MIITVNKNNYGVSLLEVMVAAFIFAVASLGFTKLKVTSVTLTQAAHNKTMAESVSEDIKVLMANYILPIKGKDNIDDRLNDFVDYDFNNVNCTSYTPLTSCLDGDLDTTCSNSEMFEAEAFVLSCNAKTTLPSATFDIASCGTGKYCIYVAWMGLDATAANCTEEENYCIKTEAYY